MRLSKVQKLRIAVAQDVIDQLDAGMKSRTRYGYIKIPARKLASCVLGRSSRADARRIQRHCTVCAKGALFLSLVSLENKYDFRGSFSEESSRTVGIFHYKIQDRLSDVFSVKQLDLIENSFEYGPNSHERLYAPKRLRKIMENIIANRGEFVP